MLFGGGGACGFLMRLFTEDILKMVECVCVCVNYIKVCECVDYIVCVYVYILYKYNVGGAKEKGLIKLFSSA